MASSLITHNANATLSNSDVQEQNKYYKHNHNMFNLIGKKTNPSLCATTRHNKNNNRTYVIIN